MQELDIEDIKNLDGVSKGQFKALKNKHCNKANVDTMYAIANLTGCSPAKVANALLNHESK